MIQKHPVLIGAGAGLLFVLLQWRLGLSFAAVGTVMDVLNAPASWAFDRWYRAGLPPQGNAAFVGPFAAAFLQWVGIGSLAGFLAHRRQKASNLPALENATTGHEAANEEQGPQSNNKSG
jgi:hypothetical protein